MTGQRIVVDRLVALGARILLAEGVPETDAVLIAESLATSDAWGHPSHGMLRLSWYVARLRTGVMRKTSSPITVTDGGAIALLDGDDGIGQIVTDIACRDAVARAKRHGIGLVAVRNSNHFGTAAYWTRRMADAGCVGILTTNGSPAMAPWGGREKTVGANPWSIAARGGSHGTVVLDIANTGVARGKIYAALQKNQPIPVEWAITQEGRPTRDPREAIEGLLLPMAGHKGYGISFMMDVLSGVLTGSGIATEVVGPYEPDRRSRCGHLAMAIDIDALVGREAFDARMDELIDLTKAVPLAEGVQEVFYPGEIENRAQHRAAQEGVWLPQKTIDELNELAETAGVPGLAEASFL